MKTHLFGTLRASFVVGAALISALSMLSTLSASAFPYVHTVCVSVPVTTIDSGIGEDHLNSPGTVNVPARWAKVTIRHGGATAVPTTYLSSSGCISFVSVFPTGFQLQMQSIARVPRTDAPGFHTNDLMARTSAGPATNWFWNFNPGIYGFVTPLTTAPSRVANLLVLGTESLYRFSDGLVDETFYVYDAACPSIPDNSCNSGSNIYINPASNDRKFLIGHEMGHAVLHRRLGQHLPASYLVNSGGADCIGTAGHFHGMHTKEHQSAALAEGFAQYYSASVWNSDSQTGGWFHYYKPNYKNGSITSVNVEWGPTGGSTAYLENHCTGSDLGYGVELDWMRALWDFRTNSGSKPSRWQILKHIDDALTSGPWDNASAGDAFSSAIATFDGTWGTSYHDRWIGLAGYNGVVH